MKYIVLSLMQEMCNELYNGQFDGSHDWLDSLMKDDRRCLVDCMLMSDICSSLNLQSPLVSAEHSYSLAADYSHSASVAKTELDDCKYHWHSLKLCIKFLLCCSLAILPDNCNENFSLPVVIYVSVLLSLNCCFMMLLNE